MASLGFSYAQAAKGLAPTPTLSSAPTSSASSEHGARENVAVSDSTSQTRPTRTSAKGDSETSTLQKHTPNITSGDGETHSEKPTSQIREVVVEGKPHARKRSSEDATANTAKTTDASSSSKSASNEDTGDKRSSTSEVHEDREKAKEADDDWEKVSIPSVAAEKELKAAPIPVVNIWQQRIEAQQAKLKEQASSQRPNAPVASQTKPRVTTNATEEPRRKSAARDATGAEAVQASSRATSNGRTSRDQPGLNTSPRSSSRPEETMTAQSLPPVDAESWPTVEHAIVDTGRRSSTLEKSDRSELVDAKAPTRKNQWTALPFVPSVKFETQLPQSRRGGRPANPRGRGGANGQGERGHDKTEPGSMGPPPLPKTISDQDRGRKGNAVRPGRASSLPHDGSRADVQDVQQMQQPAPVVDAAEPSNRVTKEYPSRTETPSTQDPSRSSSRHVVPASGTRNARPEFDSSTNQDPGIAESPTRQPQHNDQSKVSSAETYRPQNENIEKSHSKEWQKDRAGNAQKSDNWRSDRRNERADRGGRGGSYRGRGGHSAYNSSFTSPLLQNGFEGAKQNGPSDSRNRQPAQPYGAPYGSNRNIPRSQSIPISMLQGGYYGPQGLTQGLPPIQTDMAFGGYAPMPNGMAGGATSATIPFGDPLNGYALISMVVTQLEYYFSVDNLCKDMYLRKNMDSQGFVPLRVIAEFKRIKALLSDSSMFYEQLRSIAQQVRNIEFVTAEDGEDRIRSRENWKDFVLPINQRLPQAQNDGPQIRSQHPRHSTGMVPDFQMNNGLRSAPPNVNGFHGGFPEHNTPIQFHQNTVAEPQQVEQWQARVENARQEDNRRPSVTSPLSKVQSPSQESHTVFGSMTNGHRDSMSSSTTGKENTFPDEGVIALKVVVKDPDYQGRDDKSAPEISGPNRVSGLRGGAGSPEQFEKFRSLQFGQGILKPGKSNGQTLYFTQDEGPPAHYVKPGYIHEDYLTLRAKAASQRAENHFDGASVVLYPLWAEFLSVPNQFNVGMYEDFKTWALEDDHGGSNSGKKYLVEFYDTMLGAKGPISERVAQDIVNIARMESGSQRPTWAKLRTAWRNGATNMKTRKRLIDLLTVDERAGLDRGA